MQDRVTPTAAASGRRRKGLATRQRILEAAVELFADRPFDAVLALEIAERAGVAHGLMFHHFGNKRGIYLEAVREMCRRLFAVPMPDPSLPPYDQIRHIVRNHYLQMADNEALLLGHMRGSNAMASDAEALAMMDGHRAGLARWALMLLGYDPDSIALATMVRAAAAAMFDLSLKWLEEGRVWHVEEQLVEATIDILVGSLRAAKYLDPTLDVERGIRLIERKAR